MSLEKYRRPRMIVLHPRSTAHEAARAMVDNHVGVLLVSEGQSPLGIVTDRDLVTEIIAADLDPKTTILDDFMTEDAAAADVTADVEAVVALMKERRCRRVPLLEHGKAAGIVTLDDLLIEGDIDAATAAEIIRAQLEEPARYKSAGVTHPEATARPPTGVPRGERAAKRRAARAASSYTRLLKLVQTRTGLTGREPAEVALKVVLGSVCRRVTPEEARHFIAQLPSLLKEGLSEHLGGPDRQITRATMEREVAALLGVDATFAQDIVEGVAGAIADSISAGQMEELKGQLPAELKSLFPSWPLTLRED